MSCIFKETILAEEVIEGATYQLIENNIHGEISWDIIELQKNGEHITHKSLSERDWSQGGAYCKFDDFCDEIRMNLSEVFEDDEKEELEKIILAPEILITEEITCKFCKGKMESVEDRFECECGAMIQENENTWTLPFDMDNQYA